MIHSRNDMRSEKREKMRGGEGTITITHLVEKEVLKNSRLLAEVEVPVGASIGEHEHHAETEYYIILKGQGEVAESDGLKKVEAGDVVITGDGQSHSLKNTGSSPLTLIAVIIND